MSFVGMCFPGQVEGSEDCATIYAPNDIRPSFGDHWCDFGSQRSDLNPSPNMDIRPSTVFARTALFPEGFP